MMECCNKLIYILVVLMSLYNASTNAFFGYVFKNPEIAKAAEDKKLKQALEQHQKYEQGRKKALEKAKKEVAELLKPKPIPEQNQNFHYPVPPSAPNIEDELQSKSNSFIPTWKEKLICSVADTMTVSIFTGIVTHLFTECVLAYTKRK